MQENRPAGSMLNLTAWSQFRCACEVVQMCSQCFTERGSVIEAEDNISGIIESSSSACGLCYPKLSLSDVFSEHDRAVSSAISAISKFIPLVMGQVLRPEAWGSTRNYMCFYHNSFPVPLLLFTTEVSLWCGAAMEHDRGFTSDIAMPPCPLLS